MTPFVLSTTSYFLVAVILVAVVMIIFDHKRSRNKKLIEKLAKYDTEVATLPEPPGPKPWPIFGSLHLLGQYEIPYMAFADLAKKYDSPIVKLRMGSVGCVAVNGLENIKEVLIVKGQQFDSRPDFKRYHLLFCGDKENSLAFCNWSELQKARRETLRAHTFPRAFTAKFDQLNGIVSEHLENFVSHVESRAGSEIKAKPLVLHLCGNIFSNYFCSKKFALDHVAFNEMVRNFDKVFYEVNQGYAADFMPFLMPLHQRNMARMSNWSHKIREFVTSHIIGDRYSSWDRIIPEEDYVDCLINHIRTKSEPKMSLDTGLFALEDIIGGHSAIGNLIVKILGFIATRPEVQANAQREIDLVETGGVTVGLEHRGSMPYTESIILEAIRLITSPIVPHVANQDTSIGGYKVEKDTFIFLNNYELNMSEKLWTSPKEFMPERFIQNGRISKPEYFLPFGGGRRSCMGYKMVQYVGFSTIATILKNFTVSPIESESYVVPIGNLALPEISYGFRFDRRQRA
ncbi:cytochrome P450 307a1-like [Venturia canescens]|uniref:cytochrome P450 307a1-like n=1 Tax=Venturia canescens TaxID=32260 RepID=UPI001C9D0AC9|nr:cytochrome P450 307a1-like [Venturia canescens]